jgi:hypothetical protein
MCDYRFASFRPAIFCLAASSWPAIEFAWFLTELALSIALL